MLQALICSRSIRHAQRCRPATDPPRRVGRARSGVRDADPAVRRHARVRARGYALRLRRHLARRALAARQASPLALSALWRSPPRRPPACGRSGTLRGLGASPVRTGHLLPSVQRLQPVLGPSIDVDGEVVVQPVGARPDRHGEHDRGVRVARPILGACGAAPSSRRALCPPAPHAGAGAEAWPAAQPTAGDAAPLARRRDVPGACPRGEAISANGGSARGRGPRRQSSRARRTGGGDG